MTIATVLPFLDQLPHGERIDIGLPDGIEVDASITIRDRNKLTFIMICKGTIQAFRYDDDKD